MEDENTLRHIQKYFGYEFQNTSLLFEALSHSSFSNEQPDAAPRNNERLEFLGDAVTSWMVTALLWEQFPDADEGELTRRRAYLVCETGLASLAIKFGIHEIVRLGKGEEKSGGRNKSRLLCSAFEAIIGALFLDAGPERFHQLGRKIFEESIREDLMQAEFDHKSKLQQWLQSRGRSAPTYKVVQTEGPAHDLKFWISVEVDGKDIAQGNGRNKTEAEQHSAQLALEVLLIQGEES